MHSILRSLLGLVAVPLLAACEYEGTAFLIDGGGAVSWALAAADQRSVVT